MFARTQRLVLRPGWADDAPALAEALGHEQLANKLTQLPWPYGLSDAKAFLARPYNPNAPQMLILLRTAGKPRLIGGIGLNQGADALELGYWIAPDYWGLGFATEASRAMIDIARHALQRPRVLARHFVDNPASANVLRKLGFVRTGKAEARPCTARGGSALTVEYALDFADLDAAMPDMAMERRLAA